MPLHVMRENLFPFCVGCTQGTDGIINLPTFPPDPLSRSTTLLGWRKKAFPSLEYFGPNFAL